LAEIKRSAGAPRAICLASEPEAPKLGRTVMPGWLASKAAAKALKASVMLAATDSLTSAAWAGDRFRKNRDSNGSK